MKRIIGAAVIFSILGCSQRQPTTDQLDKEIESLKRELDSQKNSAAKEMQDLRAELVKAKEDMTNLTEQVRQAASLAIPKPTTADPNLPVAHFTAKEIHQYLKTDPVGLRIKCGGKVVSVRGTVDKAEADGIWLYSTRLGPPREDEFEVVLCQFHKKELESVAVKQFDQIEVWGFVSDKAARADRTIITNCRLAPERPSPP